MPTSSRQPPEAPHEDKLTRLSFQSVMTPPDAVLFDWDNTLVDTWKTIFHAMNRTLVTFGMQPWAEDTAIANIQHSGREAFPRLFGDKAQEAQSFFYKLVEEGHLENLPPLQGAEILLNTLHKRGIPLGIVSNKSGPFLRKEVAQLQWTSYFGVLVGAGDASMDKPAAAPLLRALEHLKVAASPNVWMVGDAPVDWDCALAAGCQPVAIGKRFETSSSLVLSIDDCTALEKIFRKM